MHRSQARWFSRRLPHLWGLVCWRVVRRVVLVSGQALPPPTGTAARSRPRALRLGVAGELARWFETAIAFACLCLCGIETVIAFAGEKWAFLVQYLGRRGVVGFIGPVLGRAVVLSVSTSPCFCVLCAKFVALLSRMWARARKSSPCAGLGCSAAHEVGGGGGFALHEAFRGRVVGVSDPRVVQFPPFGGGKAAA